MGWAEVLWARDAVPKMSRDLNTAARFVLMTLASRVNPSSSQCNPSVASIARTTGLSRRGVQRSLAELEESGVLRRTYGDNESTSYALILTVEGGDMSAHLNGRACDMVAPGGRHEGAGGGDMRAPKRKEGKESETKETENAGEGLDIRALEQAVLDCLPPRRRGMMLDRASAGILAAMAQKHGVEACMAAAGECGGADRPAYMLRARLEHPTRGKGGSGRGRLPDAARISENWGATEDQKLPWRTLPTPTGPDEYDPELGF